jgi:GGDEF domain-containing protein
MGAESSQIVLLAVAYVDIVGLKVENDKYGQAAGDALLQRAVRAIRTHLRSYDMIRSGAATSSWP